METILLGTTSTSVVCIMYALAIIVGFTFMQKYRTFRDRDDLGKADRILSIIFSFTGFCFCLFLTVKIILSLGANDMGLCGGALAGLICFFIFSLIEKNFIFSKDLVFGEKFILECTGLGWILGMFLGNCIASKQWLPLIIAITFFGLGHYAGHLYEKKKKEISLD